MKNQAEIENWNGPIGERWVLYQEALDARIRAYGEHVLASAGLREGMRVLDVGAGCGDMTLEAARTVGTTGTVVGVDVSRPMLARARERAKELPNLELVEHDASTFAPAAPFDALISRFGVMFFDDPAAAFTNLRAATRPRGVLTFVCWQALDKNPWASVPLSAVLRVLPPQAPATPNAPGPFAFADPERVKDILGRAGWSDVALTPLAHPMKLGDSLEDALDYASRMGPASRVLNAGDEEARARGLEALRQTLAAYAPGFALDSAVWVVRAHA